MTLTFQEKPPETKKGIELPQITRPNLDLHPPLLTLDRLAVRMGYNSEGTYKSLERAAFVTTVAGNVQKFMNEGPASIVNRFSTVLSLAELNTQQESPKEQKKQSV